MLPISISASLVVYKPDLEVLQRAVFALHEAVQLAKIKFPADVKLTLIDNSCDDTVSEALCIWLNKQIGLLPGLKIYLLRSPKNLGYGKGNNLVIEQTISDFHLVLNPDLFLESESLSQALEYMTANPDVGLLTPAVFGEDGERQYLCKRNPTLLIMFLRSFSPQWLRQQFSTMLNNFEMRDCNYDEILENIQHPTGCCMFFRSSYLKQIKGFDPDFFMYYEDADIGRRMLNVARVVYVPTFKVLHLWARGTHKSWKLRLVTIWSGLVYWRKWGGIFVSTSDQNGRPNRS